MELVNRLAGSTSPYLLQHADQPVAWQPFDDEALELARTLDRPLLISIGYAACHWCHVMAHETFDDVELAAVMNRSFIPIKIDREERPDLDSLYMTATQAATGHGGWPMTIMATPDGRPFFAGTYFPPHDAGGQPGFDRVLLAIEAAWRSERPMVESQADELAEAVATEARFVDSIAPLGDDDPLDFDVVLSSLTEELARRFDPTFGGFGPAPKFPRPSYAEACLIAARRRGDQRALEMATRTLDAMAAGGIYDHLDGGFARYSVDGRWLVPHFEKMLSDQALLASAYLHGFELTGNPGWRQTAIETLEWTLRGLGLEGGGLAASIDADAAGVEGSHAVFTPAEVAQALEGVDGVLSPAEACSFYGITPKGTFEHGRSIVARELGGTLLRSPAEEATRAALLAARQRRPQPSVDDKVLCEWNAMTAAVLSEAALVLSRPDFGERAIEIVDHLDTQLRSSTGRLLRSQRAGISSNLALLGDHAWLVIAMTRLFELDGQSRWLERASSVTWDMIDLFLDGSLEEPKGFFTTGADAPALLTRAKDVFDGALPSQTAVAMTALARMSALTGDERLRALAAASLSQVGSLLRSHAVATPDLLLALGWLEEVVEVAIPGGEPDLVRVAVTSATPFRLLATGTSNCALLDGRAPGAAYVCHHRTCSVPLMDPSSVVEAIDAVVIAH